MIRAATSRAVEVDAQRGTELSRNLLGSCVGRASATPRARRVSAKSVYLIRHGAVSIEIAAPGWDPIAIQTITDGEVLGWSWLVPPYHVAYDARVVAPTLAIAMDGTCIRDKCERDPRLGYELYKRVSGLMAERLQSTRLQLLDVYGPHR